MSCNKAPGISGQRAHAEPPRQQRTGGNGESPTALIRVARMPPYPGAQTGPAAHPADAGSDRNWRSGWPAPLKSTARCRAGEFWRKRSQRKQRCACEASSFCFLQSFGGKFIALQPCSREIDRLNKRLRPTKIQQAVIMHSCRPRKSFAPCLLHSSIDTSTNIHALIKNNVGYTMPNPQAK